MAERIGNCRVIGEIGSGGMATVLKAVQEPLGRTVAIKALKPSIAVDSQFARRFEREAHFMATLQHENILNVHDFLKDGRSMYIVMEYVEGIDLYDLLDRVPILPIDIAAIVTLQVARALDYAHFRGIIHRDIKPANIMVARDGQVKLMDFGIARDENLSDLTETGTGLGTPSYMSPEQILGDKLDFRSDIFSVGIVLYQMLTGRKPFVEDSTRTVMQKIRLDRFVSPTRWNRDVPRQLERILTRCMEKMPANRYPSTQALIDDLMEFLAERVQTNYNVRMVQFLRDVGVLTEDEADHTLQTAGPRLARRAPVDPNLLRDVARVQVGLLCAFLAVGGGVQAFAGGRPEVGPRVLGELGPLAVARDAGYLRVVVEPWATIVVDGREVGTTPMATPVQLMPGEHFVKLANPYFPSVDQRIVVRPHEITVIDVDLAQATRGGAAAGAVRRTP